jgi:hypothetical protein
MEEDEDFEGDHQLDLKSDFYQEHKEEIDFFRSYFPNENITDLQIVNYIESL